MNIKLELNVNTTSNFMTNINLINLLTQVIGYMG